MVPNIAVACNALCHKAEQLESLQS
jgi:hypothetical protein